MDYAFLNDSCMQRDSKIWVVLRLREGKTTIKQA